MIQALNSKVTVPKPSRRNPFTEGGSAARQFDQMLRLYAEGHQDLLRLGPVRCMGNNMAVAFWRGYDVFDPVKVGFVTEGEGAKQVGTRMDTTQRGSGNQGHEFGTTLGRADKEALVEYLKTL